MQARVGFARLHCEGAAEVYVLGCVGLGGSWVDRVLGEVVRRGEDCLFISVARDS